MGLFANMRLARAVASLDLDAAYPGVDDLGRGPGRTGIRLPSTPFGQSGAFSPILWNDLFAGGSTLLDRTQALTIPGVARGRGILLSLIADKPLIDYGPGDVGRIPDQPSWLYRVPGWQGPYRRMAMTLDDHIFYEASLWGCRRGAAPAGGGIRPILNAWHVPYDAWRLDDAGIIEVWNPEAGDYEPADEDEVIYLPGPSDGLLAMASRTLRGSVELEDAWIRRAKNPIPMIDLHETEETNLETDERQAVVDAWADARTDPNGAIASTPYNIEARVLGSYEADMFIGARNAARLDLANFFQLPASVMDASLSTASLTYTTTEGNLGAIDTTTIPYWARPIEDRLSQDDVIPRGHTIRFAWGEALTEPPGPIRTITANSAVVDTAAEPVGEAIGAEVADTIQEAS